MPKGKIIVITGPTASGKSALSVRLARDIDGEIISADSRQIYRGIPVMTAVPSTEEREGVPHHLLESLPLDASYSASSFESDGRRLINEIRERGKNVIVCGGSMLYIHALCYGLDSLPDIPEEIREKYLDELDREGLETLVSRLAAADPDALSLVDIRNPRRVVHALEVTEVAGKPYSSLLGKRGPTFGKDEIITVALCAPKDYLFERINRRVDRMIASGGIEEARSVLSFRHYNSLQTVGFNELFAYLDGKMDLDTAIARIGKNTRVFAKKQITWLKKHQCNLSIDISHPDAYAELAANLDV